MRLLVQQHNWLSSDTRRSGGGDSALAERLELRAEAEVAQGIE